MPYLKSSLFLAMTLCSFALAARHHTTRHVAVLHEVTRAPTQVTLAFAGRFFDYHEVVGGRTFDSESGFLPGVRLTVLQPLGGSGWQLGADAIALFGNTHYDGGTWGGAPLQGTTHDAVADLVLTVGRDLTPQRSHHWVPYLGFGGHLWARDASAMPGGYDERYWFLYVPIGIRYQHPFSKRIAIGADFSGRWNLGGWIGVKNMPNGARADTGSLGMAFGARAEVPVTFTLARALQLTVAPYFEYFGIGKGGPINIYTAQGDVGTVAQEPDSHTFLYGFSAATLVSF